MTTTSKTFALVPGAWHGAWVYKRVTARLRGEGHEVYPLTLTGLGDRSHLASDAVDMDTYVADVVNAVLWEDLTDICLVGHSYGGLVVAAAAEELAGRVSSIVFLDAFMPEDGKSMVDISPREVPDTGNLMPYSAAGMQVNEADRAWVDAKVTPQPVHTYTQKQPPLRAYLDIPKKAYVRTTFPNPEWDGPYERYTADPAWQTFVVTSGHDLMVDAPDELTKILLAVA